MKIENKILKECLYFIYVCIAYNLEGGQDVIVPTALAKMFGADGGYRVFAVGFSFEGVACLFNIFFLDKFLDASGWVNLGFGGIQYLYAGFSAVALLMLFFFKE